MAGHSSHLNCVIIQALIFVCADIAPSARLRTTDGDEAAGPVSRILSAGLLPQDGHSSGLRITAQLKRPTRRLWRAEPAGALRCLRFA